MNRLQELVITVVWALVLPIAAIIAYGYGLDLLSSLLALAALAAGWIDVVERRHGPSTDQQTS